MPSSVDPASLRDHPLMLKRIGEDDHAVLIAGHRAGRIVAGMAPGMVMMWTWTITGPYIPDALQPSHGREESLEAAKLAFRAKFEAWLEWAENLGHQVAWYG